MAISVKVPCKIVDGVPTFKKSISVSHLPCKLDIGHQFCTSQGILLYSGSAVHNGGKAKHFAGRAQFIAAILELGQGAPFPVERQVARSGIGNTLERIPDKLFIVKPAAKHKAFAVRRFHKILDSPFDIIGRILGGIAIEGHELQRRHFNRRTVLTDDFSAEYRAYIGTNVLPPDITTASMMQLHGHSTIGKFLGSSPGSAKFRGQRIYKVTVHDYNLIRIASSTNQTGIVQLHFRKVVRILDPHAVMGGINKFANRTQIIEVLYKDFTPGHENKIALSLLAFIGVIAQVASVIRIGNGEKRSLLHIPNDR